MAPLTFGDSKPGQARKDLLIGLCVWRPIEQRVGGPSSHALVADKIREIDTRESALTLLRVGICLCKVLADLDSPFGSALVCLRLPAD